METEMNQQIYQTTPAITPEPTPTKSNGKRNWLWILLALVIVVSVLVYYVGRSSSRWGENMTDSEKIDFMQSLPLDSNSPNTRLNDAQKAELMSSLKMDEGPYNDLSEAEKLKLLENN